MSVVRRPSLLNVPEVLLLFATLALPPVAQAGVELLNVSYDPTYKLYKEYNRAFAEYWQEQTGIAVTIKQSHSVVPANRRGR